MGVVNVRYFAANKKQKKQKKTAKKSLATAAGPPPLDNTIRYRGWVPHPRASFRDGTGVRLDLPFAPTGGEFTGFTRKWTPVERPLRSTILVDGGPGLRVNSYTLTVARPDGGSVAWELGLLQVMASRSDDAQAAIAVLGLSGMEGGPWRITELTIKVQRREHGTNNPTMAEVDITFAAVDRITMGIGRTKKKKSKKKKK